MQRGAVDRVPRLRRGSLDQLHAEPRASSSALRTPAGPWVRDDAGFYEGADGAELLRSARLQAERVGARPPRRPSRRMRRALSEYVVTGIRTNLVFHEKLLAHPEFARRPLRHRLHRRSIGRAPRLHRRPAPEEEEALAAAIAIAAARAERGEARAEGEASRSESRGSGLAPWVHQHRTRTRPGSARSQRRAGAADAPASPASPAPRPATSPRLAGTTLRSRRDGGGATLDSGRVSTSWWRCDAA